MSYEWNGFTPIAKGDFTSVGSGLTLLDTTFGTNLTKASGGASHSIAGMYKAAPATPYTITTCLQWNGVNPDTGVCILGPGWSDGTKYVIFYLICNNATTDGIMKIGVGQYTNSTTFSADYQQDNATYMASDNLWMQISDDGTNRLCKVSRDGINFSQIHSTTHTNFLTPTRVGMFVNPYSGAVNATFASWTGA